MIRKDAGLWMCAVGLLGLLEAPAVVRAQQPPQPKPQEYIIGPEDVLQISVFAHPELERTVTVNAAGIATFAAAGRAQGGRAHRQAGVRPPRQSGCRPTCARPRRRR